MKRRLSIFALLALWLPSCSGGAPPLPSNGSLAPSVVQARVAPGGVALGVPPEVHAVRGVATVELIAKIDPATGLPTFVFNGMKGVIPTIRVKPGDTIVVDVSNLLPPSAGMQSDMNLHFHGLVVSPNPPADNVLTTLAMPGGTLHYVVPIPRGQDPGLYWYHPHVHGETDYQVGQAGMSGAIVVTGLEEHLRGLAAMTERLLVVRSVASNAARSVMPAMSMKPHDSDTNNNPCGPDAGFTTTVNGAVEPTIAIAPGERQFFRLVNATAHKNLDLAVDGGSLELVAIDGFALAAYAGTAATRTVTHVVVPPAGRAEFVVTGSRNGPAEFRSLCYNSGPTGDPDPMIVLAHLRNVPHAFHRGYAPAPLRVARPLPRNLFTLPLPPVAATRTVVFNEDDNAMYINGQAFWPGAAPMFTVRVGTIERWNVVNITQEVHDFHMHQTHFYVEQINGVKVPHPVWADSVVIPRRTPGANGSWTPGSLTMVVDFRPPVIAGEFVFHCHILDHEDSGMMAKIRAVAP